MLVVYLGGGWHNYGKRGLHEMNSKKTNKVKINRKNAGRRQVHLSSNGPRPSLRPTPARTLRAWRRAEARAREPFSLDGGGAGRLQTGPPGAGAQRRLRLLHQTLQFQHVCRA